MSRQAARVVVQGRARACDATRPTIGPRITAAGAASAAAPLAMWPYDMRRTPPTCARAQSAGCGRERADGRHKAAAAARTCAGLISLEAPSCTSGSVPSGELPKHLMVTADGISHTAWLINFNIHVFKHLRLLKFLKETFGFDLFNVWATPDERAHKLAANVVKPLIKRFFAQNLKK